KGGLGIELDLDRVPVREERMTAYEIMLSESQERMLMILKPGSEGMAERIFRKWELDFSNIGRVTETGRLVLRMGGAIVADMPVGPLVTEAPLYDRPWTPTPARREVKAHSIRTKATVIQALQQLLRTPDLCSKRWIWKQYDHLVMGNTVQRPGGDAAVVRLEGSRKGLALAVDCTPRYCAADPQRGGAQAVAETWRNLTAVGATPLAITDNMNFGNPERPEIMGQFVGCIEGIRGACLALDYPVVSGNVSLYNETNGAGILPTPVIGGVGLIADVSKTVSLALNRAGETLVLIGETKGHLGCSAFHAEGAPPPVDLAAERRNGDFVRAEIEAGHISACHDISDGGLLVAVAEMAMAGTVGATIALPPDLSPLAAAFGEDQARYMLAVADAPGLLARAKSVGVPAALLGATGGDALTVAGHGAISTADLRQAHEAWLPDYMAGS
ncbi:MAG: AIR synthase-related protein, partial [Stellaceae bacterium]